MVYCEYLCYKCHRLFSDESIIFCIMCGRVVCKKCSEKVDLKTNEEYILQEYEIVCHYCFDRYALSSSHQRLHKRFSNGTNYLV